MARLSSIRRSVLIVMVAVALGAAACSADGGSGAAPGVTGSDSVAGTGGSVPPEATLGELVELRPLHVSEDARIVDDLDREVLLRGPNLNSLGEYWQGDPDHPPTIPVTDADWEAMADHGLSVVRLVVSWSRLEPTRGQIDETYLDLIDSYVTAAADHGLYTVIDMHQDAYSPFISTKDEAECAPGSSPGKGWDGAPEWAVITDGLSTCVTGDRNSAPAVVAAWNHFYDDTDGIRTEFARTWGVVAARFADRPEVAGYDVLNEPEVSRPGPELTPAYEALLVDAAAEIRGAEAAAGLAPAEGKLIIVEPAIPAGTPAFGLVVPDPTRMGVDTTNVVAGPHNYAGSIDNGITASVEEMSELFSSVASGLGLPVWVGEYGYFHRDEEGADWIRRFAADEDARAQGGAWWQWRQGCGDPHSIGWGRPAEGEVTHLNLIGCPGDEDLGPNEDFLRVLGRAYPRAAPGRITELTSDPDTRAFTVRADQARMGDALVVWTPTTADDHAVSTEGLTDVVEHVVPGGRLITAAVADAGGSYEVSIAGS